jgi:hypothetical protein
VYLEPLTHRQVPQEPSYKQQGSAKCKVRELGGHTDQQPDDLRVNYRDMCTTVGTDVTIVVSCKPKSVGVYTTVLSSILALYRHHHDSGSLSVL